MKGLWVGLIATPDEIVHDASGEPPFLLIEKLSQIVFSQVLGQPVMPPFSFKVTELLNASAHMTANSILIAHYVTPEQLIQNYEEIEKGIVGQAKTLQDVALQLRQGKSRKQIVADLRQITTKVNPAP